MKGFALRPTPARPSFRLDGVEPLASKGAEAHATAKDQHPESGSPPPMGCEELRERIRRSPFRRDQGAWATELLKDSVPEHRRIGGGR